MKGVRNIGFVRQIIVGRGARLDAYGPGRCLTLADDVEINDQVHIGALSNVTTGHRVPIAGRASSVGHAHASDGRGLGTLRSPPFELSCTELAMPLAGLPVSRIPSVDRASAVSSVTIADDLWFSQALSVLRGVAVGAGAVSDIPRASFTERVPARAIGRYDPVDGGGAAS